MEEGTPVLESFTQSVADGPSQPLMRKLMSLMLSDSASASPIQDPDASGFLLVEAPAGGTSSRAGALDVVEDIAQTAGCPMEDMESVVQSGFRFAGSEGCCDSPRVENYFSESQIPADLADKVPIDFLHAINNVLDTRVVPVPKGHHHHHHHHGSHGHGHGRRRAARRRAPPALSLGNKEPREEEQVGGVASTASSRDCSYAQEMMVTRRLDRLEEICLRTESYVQMVLGTMDRRLQLLEGDAISRCTQDSMTSPRFPGEGGAAAFSCEAGTFVTPEMLMVQSPRPDRMSLFATDVASAAAEVSCQGSEDPALVLSTPVPSVSQQSEYPFATFGGDRPEPRAGLDEITAMAPATPNTGDEITTAGRQEEEMTCGRPLVAAIAVFSLAPDAPVPSMENPVDALLSEPVVTWENEGFPYLRPAYQVELGPRPRDTTVLTWDAARYLALESTSSDDDHATCHSSEEAFAFCNLDDDPRRLKEDTQMLSEVSSLLQNICADLEAYNVLDARTTSSCRHCSGPACTKDQEEIISVLEEMFTRLTYCPRPEDVLVSILPVSGATPTKASSDEVAIAPAETSSHEASAIEGVQYAQLSQQEDVDEISSMKTERSFEIFPLEGVISPRVALSFIQEDGRPSASEVSRGEQAAQDMHVKIEVPPPKQDGPSEPLALHVAITPKEIRVAQEGEPAVIQDISVIVEGSYRDPVVRENDVALGEPAEAVAVSRDHLQLSGDVFANYTMKVVPRPEQQQEGGASLVLNQDDKMVINEEEVSSVIHELCFSLDVPSRTTQGDSSKEADLPLQIAIALTGSGDRGMVGQASVEDRASSLEASSSTQQQSEIASVVLNLEALQKSEENPDSSEDGPMTFNWEGIPGSSECEDIPCVIKVENRKVIAKDEFTSVHQEVRISLEVPTDTTDEAASPGVEIGIAVKSVPKRAGDEETAIYTVEIPEDRLFEKVPLTEMATVERGADPVKEELVPLKTAAAEPEKNLVIENRSLGDELLVGSILAPPPSPVEAAPETHDYVVKEEKKAEEEWVIDTSYLPKENCQKVEAKVPKTILKGVTAKDLIRGSLHFDGKACLLAVSTDDIWTAEDMCQAPVSAAKEKSSLPFLADNAPGFRSGAEPLIREIPAWLGSVLIDEMKPAYTGGVMKAFGFYGGGTQQQQQQQQPLHQPGIQRQVLGFRSMQARPALPKAAQEAMFGFRSLPPKSGRPPVPPVPVAAVKPSISVTVPVSSDGFSDWDSTLSLVTRGGQPPVSQADPTKPRVPDSPGARSCIIDGPSELDSSSGSGGDGGGSSGTSTLVVELEFDQEAQAQAKTIISDAASSQTTPTSTLTLEQTSSPPPLPSAAKMALDLLDAGSGEESSGEAQQAAAAAWSSDGLHVLPLDGLHEETFFDALECSAAGRSTGGGNSNNNGKIKRYLKDKLWNKFACYGVGLPESDSSDAAVPCHHHRVPANTS